MLGSNLHIKKQTIIILTIFFTSLLATLPVYCQKFETTAEKGEGIYRLLQRNGFSVSEHIDAFIKLNKKKLGPNNSLYAGETYKLPKKLNTSSVYYKIFGENYTETEIKSNQLRGASYYLVSGHGGPDPGAIGRYGNKKLCEDEYAYDITLRLARNLIQNGATVFMITRDPNDGIRDLSYLPPDKDEVCYPNTPIPLNHLKRLKQRTQAVNNLYKIEKNKFQRMVAIHVDSRSRGKNIDVFFYHDKRSKTGKKAANILKSKFQEKYDKHQPGRGYKGTVSTRNLYVVKNTYPVAVYIELGNINHRRDQQRFILVNNRQAIANWLAEGLIEDYKTNK